MGNLKFVIKALSTLILLCTSTLILYSQRTDNSAEIGLTFIAGRAPSLEVQRDYQIPAIGQKDITANASSIFALRLNYSRSISAKFALDIGLEGGLNSYNFCLGFEEDFVDLSLPQPFYTEHTGYDLPYAAGIFGIKYKSSLTLRSHLTFKVGIRASYYIPILTDFLIGAPLQSGQPSDIFFSQISNNNDGKIIFSPDLSLDYLLNFPQTRFSLSTGFNTSFSRNYFMNGTFQLNGDQQVLTGSFSKKMIFLNFGLGLVYRLNK